MNTGDIVYKRIPKMGDKVRPCIAIVSNTLERYLIPISSKNWNTLSTVSISFKDRRGSAVLNEAIIDRVDVTEQTNWRISGKSFHKIFERLNERLDDTWREFICNYGVQ